MEPDFASTTRHTQNSQPSGLNIAQNTNVQGSCGLYKCFKSYIYDPFQGHNLVSLHTVIVKAILFTINKEGFIPDALTSVWYICYLQQVLWSVCYKLSLLVNLRISDLSVTILSFSTAIKFELSCTLGHVCFSE